MPTQLQKVRTYIDAHPRGVIATLGKGSIPHMSAIYVSIDKGMRCHFMSKTSTRKHEDLKNNGTATLAFVDDAELIFLEISGQTYVVSDTERSAALLATMEELLSKQRSGYWIPPIAQIQGGQYVFFEMRPRIINYTKFESRSSGLGPPEEHFMITL